MNDLEPQPPPLGAELAAVAAPGVALEAPGALLELEAPPPPELADVPGAVDEWRRLYPMLRTVRMITEADRAALLALCLEWARYLEASENARGAMILKTKTGYPMVNPWQGVASKALAACLKLWPELGLTPSSRSRLHVEGPGPEGDDFSEFDDDPPAATEH